jgi:two-component system, OmpR family, phosphate regulon sensor histidine kinase PhoR
MRLKIHYKIFMILAVIFTLVLWGTYQGYKYLNQNLREENFGRIKENLIKELSLARSILEKAQKEQDTALDFGAIANEIGNELKVRATIISYEGKVLGDSTLDHTGLQTVENHFYRDEVQQALKSGLGSSRRFSTTAREEMLYVATVFGDTPKRIIRLSAPLTQIETITDQLRGMLLVLLFGAFVLTIVLSLLGSILISKPVKKVAVIAKRIAGGDFSARGTIASSDEIGDLSRTLNDMADQIKAKMDETTSTKSRLEAVLLSMSEGVMAVDSKGTIVLMNQSLRDFLSVRDMPFGRKPMEVLRNVEVQGIVDDALQPDAGVRSREITLLLPEEKVLHIHANPIKQGSKIEGAVLVFHDITELRRLEKIRQDFVANVSHELRTPLSNIKGYAETLIDGAINDHDNAMNFLNTIHTESERLSNLIEDLLSLSKIESGKLKMALAPCNIIAVIEQSVSSLEKHAKEKSISVSINIPADIPNVIADEARLSQVFFNLIDNAIKYTHEGGKINITVRDIDKFVQVEIEDNGIGIPEADISRIFERFYRVDRARSRELGGTGLGLSIVKHIVQALGGEVRVASTLGLGSTFIFTIPKSSSHTA